MAQDKTMSGVGEPASNAEDVTPDDGSDLATVSRALYIGMSGNLTVVMAGEQTVMFAGVPSGTFMPIRVKRVKASGTSASQIINLY